MPAVAGGPWLNLHPSNVTEHWPAVHKFVNRHQTTLCKLKVLGDLACRSWCQPRQYEVPYQNIKFYKEHMLSECSWLMWVVTHLDRGVIPSFYLSWMVATAMQIPGWWMAPCLIRFLLSPWLKILLSIYNRIKALVWSSSMRTLQLNWCSWSTFIFGKSDTAAGAPFLHRTEHSASTMSIFLPTTILFRSGWFSYVDTVFCKKISTHINTSNFFFLRVSHLCCLLALWISHGYLCTTVRFACNFNNFIMLIMFISFINFIFLLSCSTVYCEQLSFCLVADFAVDGKIPICLPFWQIYLAEVVLHAGRCPLW